LQTEELSEYVYLLSMEVLEYICVICDGIENLELGGFGYLIHCGLGKEIIIIIVIVLKQICFLLTTEQL